MSYKKWRADFDARCWSFDVASFERWRGIFLSSATPYCKDVAHRNMVRIAAEYPSAKLHVPEHTYKTL